MSLKRSASVRSKTKPSSPLVSKPEALREVQNESPLDCTLSDCSCPICLDILIEPVTMPCSHELCLPCFKSMTDLTNFLCPMCRQRISTWYRTAANSNSLVNEERWTFIKKNFPKEIKNRIEGKTAQIIADQIEKQKKGIATDIEDKTHQLCSKPGEIRKEYQEYLKREEERIRIEKENEEKKSLELIQKLIQEEEMLSMNDYLNLLNRTPNPPRPNPNQPLRQLSNTNTINRQINNLNSHLIERVNSRNDLDIQVQSVAGTSNPPEVEINELVVGPTLRSKRKHTSSISSDHSETTPMSLSGVSSTSVRRANSCRGKRSSLQTDTSIVSDANENSVVVVDEETDVVRRGGLRPRRAKLSKN